VKPISFIHTGDIHLDAAGVFSSRGKDWYERRRKDRFLTFERIIDLCIEEKVDFLFIAGDLYEHKTVKPSTVHFLHNQFLRIPEVQVVITPGNHDPYLVNSFYHVYPWSQNVHIFAPQKNTFVFDKYQLAVHGQAFDNFQVKGNGFSDLHAIEGMQNIFILHASLSPAGSQDSQFMPCQKNDLERLKGDYIALGHFHNHQIVWEDEGEIKACYCGSPEPLAIDEEGPRTVIHGVLSNGKLTCKFIPISQMEVYHFCFPLDEISTESELIRQLSDFLAPYLPAEQKIYSIDLTGWRTEDFPLDIERIERLMIKDFPNIIIHDLSMIYYDLDALELDPSIIGRFVRRMKEKMELAEDENKRKAILDGIYLGLDALIHKEVKKRI